MASTGWGETVMPGVTLLRRGNRNQLTPLEELLRLAQDYCARYPDDYASRLSTMEVDYEAVYHDLAELEKSIGDLTRSNEYMAAYLARRHRRRARKGTVKPTPTDADTDHAEPDVSDDSIDDYDDGDDEVFEQAIDENRAVIEQKLREQKILMDIARIHPCGVSGHSHSPNLQPCHSTECMRTSSASSPVAPLTEPQEPVAPGSGCGSETTPSEVEHVEELNMAEGAGALCRPCTRTGSSDPVDCAPRTSAPDSRIFL